MDKILTVAGRTQTEKIIEKSRFLTYSEKVDGEEETRTFLREIRALHPLATHCTYAYVSDRLGNAMRFSDDGEPQGTAGMPILEVLKTKKLRQTAVAVVRYFGGIKLGAGGLTRAYSSCASENLNAAHIVSSELCSVWKVAVPYTATDSVKKFFSMHGLKTEKEEYGEDVRLFTCVKKSEEELLKEQLTDFTQGKAKAESVQEKYSVFEL